VSFEQGGTPPFDAIHALFVPMGLLIQELGGDAGDPCRRPSSSRRVAQAVESGELTRFLEIELWERRGSSANVAHRFSAYAKSGVSKGVAFQARGMISTQFLRTPAGLAHQRDGVGRRAARPHLAAARAVKVEPARVSLREIIRETVIAVTRLAVADSQKGSSRRTRCRSRRRCSHPSVGTRAIYLDDTPVGS
jgi:hypothetical protein